MEVEQPSLDVEVTDSKMSVDGPIAGEGEMPEPQQVPSPMNVEEPNTAGDTAQITAEVSSEMNIDVACPAAASGSSTLVSPEEPAIPKETNGGHSVAQEQLQPQAPDDSQGASVADLEIADLEGCGLDGTMLWLQRFRSHLEKLWAMQPKGRGAVEVVLRLVRNILEHPYDEKFRRVRADNPKIQAALLGGDFKESSEAIMTLLGFERTTDSTGQSFFVLGDKTFDTVKLQMGKELLESQLQPQLAQ